MRLLRLLTVSLLVTVVSVSCGGSKVLKNAEPLELKEPLAGAADQRLSATLDWVIVRDGPGTWAKNADWDEYLLRVRNISDQPLRVIDVYVYDSLGTRVGIGDSRRLLVDGSKRAAKRYRDQGLKVKAGLGGATLAAGGAAVYSASAAMGVAALTGTGAASSAAAVGAVAGAVVFAPALALGGIVRGINNSNVDGEIKSRRTPLPLELPAGEEARLSIFFPLTPSPSHVEIGYADPYAAHRLRVNTQPALAGLHLDSGGPAR